MMSETLLARGTFSFRRGYLDGYQGVDTRTDQSDQMKPFAEFDYNEGHMSGEIDRYCDSKPIQWQRENRAEMLAEMTKIRNAHGEK